jgi:hypothetical protein
MKSELTIMPDKGKVWTHNGQRNNCFLQNRTCQRHGVEQMKWEKQDVY